MRTRFSLCFFLHPPLADHPCCNLNFACISALELRMHQRTRPNQGGCQSPHSNKYRVWGVNTITNLALSHRHSEISLCLRGDFLVLSSLHVSRSDAASQSDINVAGGAFTGCKSTGRGCLGPGGCDRHGRQGYAQHGPTERRGGE